ncbi:hypothetical protein D7V97_03895 [Corallococcus sp. CA053C]|uniref:hypothetical protein n=1 Tax=Corallococcus sp. CA053C TaxID=2316732 RepID=UPI000EA14FC1|nr:hypothetical protein [Corallococcus sp. CA053C]RKH14115.1 hypothetical protein D7V97_03895 [Corallococcus sp. CA053C]
MQGKSSPESSPWWELPLDWPVEHVPCQLQVVEPRRLTTLEWAVLRVLEAFADAPPSMEEMTEELGLGEPRFLMDVLQTLLSLEALQTRADASTPPRLVDVQFTERGRELFHKGQVDAEPKTLGHPLCFDALTDEALPATTEGRSEPRCPAIDPSRLSVPRSEVGLERLRALVKSLGPPVGGSDALIRSVRVLTPGEASKLRSGVQWVTHPLAWIAHPDGRFTLHTPSLTAAQREWLLATPVRPWSTPARAVTRQWAPHPPFHRGGQPLAMWSSLAERLIPVSLALQEAKRLLDTARREVLLHAAWAAAPGLADCLAAAANRGVAVYVLGTATASIRAWSTAKQRPPGFIIEASAASLAPGALVVDGGVALLLDEVRAEVEDLGRESFEVVGMFRTNAMTLGAQLRQAVLESLPALPRGLVPAFDLRERPLPGIGSPTPLDEPSLRMGLARLALHPTASGWSEIVSWLSSEYQGTARVDALQQVASVTSQLIPDASPAPWREAGALAWQGLQKAVLGLDSQDVPDDVLRALIRLAPGETTPETVVEALVGAWLPLERRLSPTDALSLLGRLRTLIDERWKGAAPRCPGFSAALERGLEVSTARMEGQDRAGLVRLVASVAPADRAVRWAWAMVALGPEPHHLQDFDGWRGLHEPLEPLLGPALSSHHAARWKSLVAAEPGRTEAVLAEQLRRVQGLLPATDAVACLLAIPVTADLLQRAQWFILVRSACRTVWPRGAPDDGAWNQHLRALWIVPRQDDAIEVHGSLIAELTHRFQSWPGADAVVREWAHALVITLPPPVRAEGMTWWLESLQAVAAALGPELLRTASVAPRRHAGALRDARQQASVLWEQVNDAWKGLGLEPASLEALIEPSVVATPADPPRRNDRKRRKR